MRLTVWQLQHPYEHTWPGTVRSIIVNGINVSTHGIRQVGDVTLSSRHVVECKRFFEASLHHEGLYNSPCSSSALANNHSLQQAYQTPNWYGSWHICKTMGQRRCEMELTRHHAPVLRPSCGLGRAVIDLTQVDS